MTYKHLLPLLILLSVLFIHCQPDATSANGPQSNRQLLDQIAVSWELNSNQISDKHQFRSTFQFQNKGSQTLDGQGWQLFFNMSPRRIVPGSVQGPATVEQINGDFYRLIPSKDFSLAPGQEVRVVFEGGAWMIKEADAPCGLYFGFDDQSWQTVKNFELRPFQRPEQISRHKKDPVPIPTAATYYQRNQRLTSLPKDQLTPIIPTPLRFQKTGRGLTLQADFKILYDEGMVEAARRLQEGIQSSMGIKLFAGPGKEAAPKHILLQKAQLSNGLNGPEAYQLSIDADSGIQIKGGGPAGVFYGIQSLLALFPPEVFGQPQTSIELPGLQIEDAPMFAYRGLHIDVARNFTQVESILKVIDAMAAYKLNRLHLHLSEDEAWRLEIKGFPELTQIGGCRGHTLDDHNHLQPSYGSGPDPDDKQSAGNGYYTREEFIRILRYANAHQIEVIPEINMPGHARAAIKAMEHRYRKLSAEGKMEEAEQYRLIDPDDQSEYLSAQHYNDNVVCVCRPSVYDFYAAVVDDVIAMYKEAKAPLSILHTGGDEVPNGVWDQSPICQKMRAEKSGLESKEALQAYFLGKVNQLLEERKLVTGGWEEIVLEKDADGRFVPIESFADKNVLPYIWNNYWGNEDLAYRIANKGFDVILCNVSNLYFDLAYDKDPSEPGLYWGGFIDTEKAYHMNPFDIFKSMDSDPMGNRYDPNKDFQKMERLKPSAYKHIAGLQGQLWSETVKSPEMLEYYLFPKILGLAERAWSAERDWMRSDNPGQRQKSFQEDWNGFANRIGKIESVRMDKRFGGLAYRLPPPGAVLKEGRLYANVSFPGLSIRYTTDGSAPTADSPLYEEGVAVSGEVRLATFDTRGRHSRIVEAREQLEN
ncbi:MAG: family 20 glycosylhydrolase [Bacteroidota bacterium]